jgi:hypothetical protein
MSRSLYGTGRHATRNLKMFFRHRSTPFCPVNKKEFFVERVTQSLEDTMRRSPILSITLVISVVSFAGLGFGLPG